MCIFGPSLPTSTPKSALRVRLWHFFPFFPSRFSHIFPPNSHIFPHWYICPTMLPYCAIYGGVIHIVFHNTLFVQILSGCRFVGSIPFFLPSFLLVSWQRLTRSARANCDIRGGSVVKHN